MKKIFSFMLAFALVFVIAACGGGTTVTTDQDRVDKAIADLTLESAFEARDSFTLPARSNDVDLTWSSSNTDVVRIQPAPRMAIVTRPEDGEADATVTLSVEARRGTATASTTFTVSVPAWSSYEAPLREALEELMIFRTDFVISDIYLPVSHEGVSIDWSSSHPAIIATDGTVTRPTGPTNQTVMLTATLTHSFAGDDYVATKNFFAQAITTANTYTYRTSISEVTNINPHDTTLANASDLYGLLGGGLYIGDFDWEAAGTVRGDFRNAADLEYNRFPLLAAEMPIDVREDGTLWQFVLREDLYFEDGYHIDADTMVYSWKMLIDPDLGNVRASIIYDDLNVVNARQYALQNLEDYDPIEFEEVGIRAVSQYVFEIEVENPMTEWNLLDNILSAITGPVHPVLYEELMDDTRTRTEYGRGDVINTIISYGAYSIAAWEEGQVYLFEKRADFHQADHYRFDRIRYEVIMEQSQVVDEFRSGNLDVAGVGGVYYEEFQDWPNLKLTPTMATFRWATNIGERSDGNTNPMMQYVEFRQAIYHAVDRAEMTQTVTAPSIPNQGLVSPEYVIHYTATQSYRATAQAQSVFDGRSPETYGYNPALAQELFDTAYDKAVTDGVIEDGDTVWIELVMLDAETNWTTNTWVRDNLEAIFGDRFEFRITALTTDGMDEAGDAGNFDIMFYAWQGVKFDPIFLLGYVWNEEIPLMNERGWEPTKWQVEVHIPGFAAHLPSVIEDHQALLADLEADKLEMEEAPDFDAEDEDYVALLVAIEAREGRIVALEEMLDELVDNNGLYTMGYADWMWETQAGGLFYDEYDNREDDLLNIAAAMESRLLDEVIAIPLFTNVGTAAYSQRVIFENDVYHPWMGWGGFRYMYLNQPDN